MALGGGCPAKLTSIDLQRVTELRLAHLRLNDDGLMDVAKLECLEKLFLGCTQITDAGLYSLRELRFLKTLYLQETQITATGIRMLAEIKQLSHLDLSKTKLSYDNLYCELPGLKRLSSVRLDGVNLTGKQVVKLRDSFYDSCGHRLEILHIDSQY